MKPDRQKHRSGSTPAWDPKEAARIRRTPDSVIPSIGLPERNPADGLHLWDTWLLRDRHGELATVDGWRVLFALTASEDLLPGKRHDVAEIRYFFSPDGRTWTHGGDVFGGTALGQRQWAGSALYDDSDLYLYYTATGEEDAGELTYDQRIAVAHGGSISVSDDAVEIDGPWTHDLLLEPDGELYETRSQSRGMIYTFRDPWFFEDPTTGAVYLLFEANTPVPEGSEARSDLGNQEFNGSVGLARSPTGDPLDWELTHPLLDAVRVNQELERPHIVLQDGRYYLFLSSHMHTFAPDIEGFDALYGFVADSLRGEYEPLNESGLVLTNPVSAPYQSYSWMAYPHSEDILVQYFVNYHEFEGESLDEIANLPQSEQLRGFGGTLGPTARLAVEGTETRVLGLLDHWHIPTKGETLPPTDRDWDRAVEDVSRSTQDSEVVPRGRGHGYWADYVSRTEEPPGED